MGDIQLSRPVIIALVGAILVGGFMLFQNSQSGEEVIPPSQPAPPGSTSATGATGEGATGKTGATGKAGDRLTREERRARLRAKRLAKWRAEAKEKGIPFSVYRELRQGRTVLIFFWEPEGKDDQRVNDAVKRVVARLEDSGADTILIREQLKNKSRYDGLALAATITQTPAVLMLYRDKADVHQGYIDADTLFDEVWDLHDSRAG